MVKLSKETHLEMFTKMERIREFDSRINKLVRHSSSVEQHQRWLLPHQLKSESSLEQNHDEPIY